MPRTQKSKSQSKRSQNKSQINNDSNSDDPEPALDSIDRKTIDNQILPYLLPMLLNLPSNEVTIEVFREKLKYLIVNLIAKDINLEFNDYNPETMEFPMKKTLEILKRCKRVAQKEFHIRFELDMDKWCLPDKDQPNTNRLVIRTLNSELIANE